MRGFLRSLVLSGLALGCIAGTASSQPAPSAPAQPPAAAPLANSAAPAPPPAPVVPARTLFGATRTPAAMPPQAIGEYAKGCLAGAVVLPITGRSWQVMRLKRNRNWGHPALIDWLQRYSDDAKAYDGWSGMLIGDMSQPRGGPMLTGHASHQLGLDADIWFLPAPARTLTSAEREDTSAISMVGADKLSVDPKTWDESRARIIKRAATSPGLERVFVHPAIKRALCLAAPADPAERIWLSKVRPWWGHDDHFHVRIACPPDSPGCKPQQAVPADDGCGKELDDWFRRMTAPPPPPPPPGTPVKPPPPPLTLERMPAECKSVLEMK